MEGKKGILFAILGSVLVIALVAGVILLGGYSVKIDVPGGDPIVLEAGEEAKLPEAKAVLSGTWLKKTSVEVRCEGEVDITKPGTYQLTFVAQHWNETVKVTRTVIVKDTKAPVITLVSDPNKTTLPGVAYEEEGFTAVDTVDGDVTEKVAVREENGQVIYTVTDNAGNTAEVRREIQYKDDQAPVITLNGKSTMVIYEGQTYREPGFTAMDNGVTDLTSKVTVSGANQITGTGTYKVTYTVKDAAGNQAVAARTVVVQPVDGNGKVIYLTFDDGPSAYTARLLDILKKYNVKATFFVCTSSRLELTKRMVAEGHSLGLHSDSHTYKEIYASEEAFFEDLNIVRDAVYEQVGFYPTLMRFPGGSSNRVSIKINPGIMTKLAAAVEAQGYRYFDWDVNSKDAEGVSADVILQEAIKGCARRESSVVLMHDIVKKTVDNVIEEFIVWALDNGYTFLPITDTTPDCHHKIKN